MSEPTIGVGETIDPATDPALCVACYLGEHGRCGPPCDCTHDGPPAPRDGRYVQDEDSIWWPRDSATIRSDVGRVVFAVIGELSRAFRVPRRLLVHRETPERRRMHQQYRARQIARRRRGRRS